MIYFSRLNQPELKEEDNKNLEKQYYFNPEIKNILSGIISFNEDNQKNIFLNYKELSVKTKKN